MLIDGIITYDRAEAADAYIGQINMITASSFNGLTGSIWGYDLAVAEEIRNNTQKPMFFRTWQNPLLIAAKTRVCSMTAPT